MSMLPPPAIPYIPATEAVNRSASRVPDIAGRVVVATGLVALVVLAFAREVALVLLVAAVLLRGVIVGLESYL